MKNILKKFPKEIIILFFLILVCKSLLILTAFIQAEVVEGMLQMNLSIVLRKSLRLFIIYLIYLIITYCQLRYTSIFKQRVSFKLRNQLADNLSKLQYQDYKKTDSSSYVSWLNNDINHIEVEGTQNAINILADSIEVILSVGALLTFHYSLIISTLIAIVILLQLPKLVNTYLNQAAYQLAQSRERFVSHTSDVLKGFDTLYVFLEHNFFKRAIFDASNDLKSHENQYNRMISIVALLGGLGNVISQVSIFVLTAYLAVQGIVPRAAIVATTNLASKIFNVVGNLSQTLVNYNSVSPIIQKLNCIDSCNSKNNNPIEHNIKVDNTTIKIKNLSYNYGSKNVFEQLSFTIYPGKKYAILGDSGSGKSTLLNILTGKLTDYSGSITLDGHEINQLSASYIFNKISYIDQKPYFFNRSLRENLTLGNQFTDDQLWSVLKKVNMDQLIAQLPDQLNSLIGEGGNNFSGGQLQRIAVARALLRNKSILFIDEATANLDEQSTLQIEDLVLSQSNLTVVLISHHLKAENITKFDYVIQLT